MATSKKTAPKKAAAKKVAAKKVAVKKVEQIIVKPYVAPMDWSTNR